MHALISACCPVSRVRRPSGLQAFAEPKPSSVRDMYENTDLRVEEVQGNKVRACFHDRCWAEDAMQCSDYSDTSATIDLWMNVQVCKKCTASCPHYPFTRVSKQCLFQCDIGPFDAGPEDSWTTFQTFGPTSITG